MKASEIEGVLTLEQLEQMDGQRVLILDTCNSYGGFGLVDVSRERVTSLLYSYWEFSKYGREWVAVKDPYGIVEIGGENDVQNNNKR